MSSSRSARSDSLSPIPAFPSRSSFAGYALTVLSDAAANKNSSSSSRRLEHEKRPRGSANSSRRCSTSARRTSSCHPTKGDPRHANDSCALLPLGGLRFPARPSPSTRLFRPGEMGVAAKKRHSAGCVQDVGAKKAPEVIPANAFVEAAGGPRRFARTVLHSAR